MSDWSVTDALNTYNIPYWGQGYFGINDSGEIVVSRWLQDDR